MNLLDFHVTPLWQAWEAVGELAAEDGVELAESELIGLAPLAAFMGVADHAGVPADAPTGERLAAAAAAIRLRDFSPLMALELRLAAARDAPHGPDARMTLRLIEGGRGARGDAPGLLIHGASQVATLAGGIRRGARPGRPRAAGCAPTSGGPGAPGAPGRRVLGGPDRRGRARATAWSTAWS